MSILYLIADESGAKQRSIKGEKYPGELGVMAGLLLLEEEFAPIERKLDNIAANYSSASKLHITDLPQNLQASLRQDLFAILLSESVTCVYEAISSQGFHKADTEIRHMEAKAKQMATSNVAASGQYPIDFLHRQLFEGLFCKAVAYGLEKLGESFGIKVIVDPVDESVLRELRKTASELLGKFDMEISVSGFDRSKNEVLHSKVDLKVTGIDDLDQISFHVDVGSGSLVLVADVLANSLLYHLESNKPSAAGLNNAVAVEGHPLGRLFFGTSDSDISDALFKAEEASKGNGGETA